MSASEPCFHRFAVAMKGHCMSKESMQRTSDRNQIYTVKDIAAILNISERSAYNFINKTREFKVLRIGRCLRVSKDTFDEWFFGKASAFKKGQ